jgi:hypothetical protein
MDSTLKVRFTDTVGTKANGYAYYMDLTFNSTKIKYWYTLKYEYDHENVNCTALNVIMASDSTNWVICYKDDDKYVQEYLNILEKKLVMRINNNTSH